MSQSGETSTTLRSGANPTVPGLPWASSRVRCLRLRLLAAKRPSNVGAKWRSPRVRTRSGERRPNRRTAGPAPRQQTQLRELGPDDYDVSQGGRDIGAQLQSPVLRCPSTCPACGLSVAQCSRRVCQPMGLLCQPGNARQTGPGRLKQRRCRCIAACAAYNFFINRRTEEIPWPGPLRHSSRFASASRSTATCRRSSDPQGRPAQSRWRRNSAMHLLRIGETVVDRDVDKAFSSLLVTQHQPSGPLQVNLRGSFFVTGAGAAMAKDTKVSSGPAWRPARSTQPPSWVKRKK